MRRALLVSLTVIFGIALVAPLGAAGAGSPATTPPGPPQVVSLTGTASGTEGTLLSAAGSQTDTGTYSTSGQLGRGTYRFDETFTGSCAHAGDANPGTGSAKLVRSDGAVLTGTLTVTTRCGQGTVTGADLVVTLTHGSRDLVGASLQWRGTITYLATPSGTTGPESFRMWGTVAVRPLIGYIMVGSNGVVHAFGGVARRGNAPTQSAVHLERTSSGKGYWIVDSAGRVFAFGDAHWFGNAKPSALASGESVTSLSATPTGDGYWLFTDRGRVLPFGHAKFYGDLHSVALNGAVTGSAATPTGLGYYLVARDGGVFTFGDAKFLGSMGGAHLNQPVVGMLPDADTGGYWLVASDGGVFTFHAPFLGSMGGVPLNQPVVGMMRYGSGYILVASDGGVFKFSPLPFFGSLGGSSGPIPITSAATTW